MSLAMLETIAKAGRSDEQSRSGIAFQVDVEDAVGVSHQGRKPFETVGEAIWAWTTRSWCGSATS